MSISEKILADDKNRFVLFPIKYHEIWKMYKKAVASFWTPDEISFSDTNDWELLSENEKYFIKNVLAFFAGSDGIVMENLATKFYNEVSIPEAKAFYSFQMAIESIHSETYSLLIDTYIKDEEDKRKLFTAIENVPSIHQKANWACKWISDQYDFAVRLIAFAIVEGVFFSASFASIYFIKEKGILESLTFSNELISRDESLHTEFAILLFSMISNKPDESIVHDIMQEAVNIEIDFITESLPCSLLGMNSDLMTDYVKYVSDRLLTQLGYQKLYNIPKCPLDFMERISMTNKSNFFDVRVAEYSKASIDNEKTPLVFDDSDDF